MRDSAPFVLAIVGHGNHLEPIEAKPILPWTLKIPQTKSLHITTLRCANKRGFGVKIHEKNMIKWRFIAEKCHRTKGHFQQTLFKAQGTLLVYHLFGKETQFVVPQCQCSHLFELNPEVDPDLESSLVCLSLVKMVKSPHKSW